jgi:hypothetical protein
MNCNDLEAIVSDLARGQLIDAALGEKAFSHSASCARCATRLADERALTAGLRRLAATETENAPARVEAALLAAFREQRSAIPARAPVSGKFAGRRWLYAAAGAAAAAVTVILLSLSASRPRDSQQPPPQEASAARAARTEGVAREPAAQPASLPSGPGRKFAIGHPPRRSLRGETDELKTADKSKSAGGKVDDSTGELEIATDFMPLMNRDSLPQADGGQVMRVELPRSALMSFGIPMNMERAGERIKADVLVGNDGLARAIRFVR